MVPIPSSCQLEKRSIPSSLGAIPENFVVAQFVPQLAVLRKADVFITHGGMEESISEAVLNQVPMVVVPNTTEQSIEEINTGKAGGGVIFGTLPGDC